MEIWEDPEWVEAQKINISIDLIAKTKKHLQFLKAVDDNGKLYNGPILERAIFRYKYCWLPLLAKHSRSKNKELELVVPLDCEWIWHCHRLNPLRYLADCRELFGRILDPCGVVISSVEGTCKKETQELWNKMYPEEAYELDINECFENDKENILISSSPSTKYDLVSAVERQRSFYYQVSREFMKDDIFLEGAAQRYKGFLHLIRINKDSKLDNSCVPTYDIDLMWHTHQLHPISYCNDMVSLIGKVLDHDDMDSDRSKGQKLDVGFARTTKQWKDTFSSRYWRAGAMYRGITPLHGPNQLVNPNRSSDIMFVEIMVEIIELRNLSRNHNGNLVLSISKKQHDRLLMGKIQFSIFTETAETQAVLFQCEPKGQLLFELIDCSAILLGTCLTSLEEPDSKLAIQKWYFESGLRTPITLGIAMSTTRPSLVQHVVTKCSKHSGGGACGTTCILASEWATSGLCSCSGGCGGGCGGGGCRASCGGCRSSCGGGGCGGK